MEPNTHSDDWSEERLCKFRRLIRDLYALVSELESEFDRKFTPDGHLVGSIGEVVAAYAFGLRLLPASADTHDALAPDNSTPVQIKLTGGTRCVALNSKPTHLIVLQLTNRQFQLIYNGPGASAWERCGKQSKNGQRTISLALLKKLDKSAIPKLKQIREFPSLALETAKSASAS